MSILLEALRKSEKSQRSREVPTIHSEVPASQASQSLKAGPLVLLLVLTSIVCGWFVWNQYRSPKNVEQVAIAESVEGTGPAPSVMNDKPSDAGATMSSPANQPATPPSNKKAAQVDPQASADDGTQKGTSPKLQSGSQTIGQRTPVESYRSSEREKRNAAKLAEMAVVPAQKPSQLSTNDGSFSNDLKGANTDLGASQSKVATDGSYRPGAPALLGYWDLPDSLRANVPEIKFSVLVYDKNPENRFVLINGQRLRQGDSPLPGLVVNEIRRDGVVFSYRLYQFLVEK